MGRCISSLLAATDLSTHGGHAVPHAFSMLTAGGAVRLVHVVEPRGRRESQLTRLRGLIPAEATRHGLDADVEVIESRDPATAICEATDRFDADLICIGSHGHSSLLAAAMGSVAHAVVARSSHPVLVIRPHSP